MSQVKKLQTGGIVKPEKQPRLFKVGTREVDLDSVLSRADRQLSDYLKEKNWNQRKQQAFLDAYSNIVNDMNTGSITSRGLNRSYTDPTGKLQNVSKGFDPVGEAAHFIDDVLDNTVDYVKPEAPTLDSYDKDDIQRAFSNAILGGNQMDEDAAKVWMDRDTHDKAGVYSTLNRQNAIADVLQNYLDNIKDRDWDFTDTPYKDKADLENTLRTAIATFRDGKYNNADNSMLLKLGLSPNLLLDKVPQPEVQNVPASEEQTSQSSSTKDNSKSTESSSETSSSTASNEVPASDKAIQDRLMREYVNPSYKIQDRDGTFLPRVSDNIKSYNAIFFDTKRSRNLLNYIAQLGATNLFDPKNLMRNVDTHYKINGQRVAKPLGQVLANYLTWFFTDSGADSYVRNIYSSGIKDWYIVPGSQNGASAVLYNPHTGELRYTARYRIPDDWNRIKREAFRKKPTPTKGPVDFSYHKEGGVLKAQEGIQFISPEAKAAYEAKQARLKAQEPIVVNDIEPDAFMAYVKREGWDMPEDTQDYINGIKKNGYKIVDDPVIRSYIIGHNKTPEDLIRFQQEVNDVHSKGWLNGTVSGATRRVGALADATSGVAAFFPGAGSAVSLGAGALGTIANALADYNDPLITTGEATQNLANNIGLDLIGIIPGLKVGTNFGKAVRTTARGATKFFGGLGLLDAGKNLFNSLNRSLSNPEGFVEYWKNPSEEDISALGGIGNLATVGGRSYQWVKNKKSSINDIDQSKKTIETEENGRLNNRTVITETYNKLNNAKSAEERNKILQDETGIKDIVVRGEPEYSKSTNRTWYGKKTGDKVTIKKGIPFTPVFKVTINKETGRITPLKQPTLWNSMNDYKQRARYDLMQKSKKIDIKKVQSGENYISYIDPADGQIYYLTKGTLYNSKGNVINKRYAGDIIQRAKQYRTGRVQHPRNEDGTIADKSDSEQSNTENKKFGGKLNYIKQLGKYKKGGIVKAQQGLDLSKVNVPILNDPFNNLNSNLNVSSQSLGRRDKYWQEADAIQAANANWDAPEQYRLFTRSGQANNGFTYVPHLFQSNKKHSKTAAWDVNNNGLGDEAERQRAYAAWHNTVNLYDKPATQWANWIYSQMNNSTKKAFRDNGVYNADGSVNLANFRKYLNGAVGELKGNASFDQTNQLFHTIGQGTTYYDPNTNKYYNSLPKGAKIDGQLYMGDSGVVNVQNIKWNNPVSTAKQKAEGSQFRGNARPDLSGILKGVGRTISSINPYPIIRLMQDLRANRRMTDEMLKAQVPLVSNSDKQMWVRGDLSTKQQYYNRGAQYDNLANRNSTSDANLIAAKQLDAMNLGNTERAKGDLADNNRIFDTSKASIQLQFANQDQRDKDSNVNNEALVGLANARNNLRASLISVNQTSWDNYLSQLDYDWQKNQNQRRSYALNVASNSLQNDYDTKRDAITAGFNQWVKAHPNETDVTKYPGYYQMMKDIDALGKKNKKEYLDLYGQIYGLSPYTAKDGTKLEQLRIKMQNKDNQLFMKGIENTIKRNTDLLKNLSGFTKDLIMQAFKKL